jgi:hypothetical protein
VFTPLLGVPGLNPVLGELRNGADGGDRYVATAMLG